MSHIVYFYFAGQSISLLFARWWLSLLTIGFIVLIDLISTNFKILVVVYWVDSIGALLGWVCGFYTSEFMLKMPKIDFVHDAKKFKYSMVVVFQILVFLGVLSLPLLFLEPSVLLFIGMVLIHGLGMIPVIHISYSFSDLRARKARKFYLYWISLILATDIVYMITFGIFEQNDLDVVFYVTLVLSVATPLLSILLIRRKVLSL